MFKQNSKISLVSQVFCLVFLLCERLVYMTGLQLLQLWPSGVLNVLQVTSL